MSDKKMVSHGYKQEKDGGLKTSFSLKGLTGIPCKAALSKANMVKFIAI